MRPVRVWGGSAIPDQMIRFFESRLRTSAPWAFAQGARHDRETTSSVIGKALREYLKLA